MWAINQDVHQGFSAVICGLLLGKLIKESKLALHSGLKAHFQSCANQNAAFLALLLGLHPMFTLHYKYLLYIVSFTVFQIAYVFIL